MSSMLETVAKAIESHFSASERAYRVPMEAARDALKAMREPTPEMLEAAKPWPAIWPKEGPDLPMMNAAYTTDQLAATSVWQAMIDAALAEVAQVKDLAGRG